MEFVAKLNDQQTNQVVNLLDQAVRAGGIQSARVAIPIIDSLSAQVAEYNKTITPSQVSPDPIKE